MEGFGLIFSTLITWTCVERALLTRYERHVWHCVGRSSMLLRLRLIQLLGQETLKLHDPFTQFDVPRS